MTAVILGLDPGLATTGFAVLETGGGRRELIAAGVLTTPASTPGPQRLCSLYEQMNDLIVQHHPGAAAVEQLFFASNVTTAMQVAEARGVIMLSLALSGVETWEYTPMQVKVSLTGYGKATKAQISKMVRAVVNVGPRLRDDAYDAVAIALCHAQSQRLQPGRRVS